MKRSSGYFLLIVFSITIFIIVFLQYNSNKNINNLISGNNEILKEVNLKNTLQKISTDVFTLESSVRGIVINDNSNEDSIYLEKEFENVTTSLKFLANISDNDVKPLIKNFSQLVIDKLNITRKILDVYNQSGKKLAEQLMIENERPRLTDSIHISAQKIDKIHERNVRKMIVADERNGRNAKAMGMVMAIIASLACVLALLYITFKFREQQLLIARLDESEKKAREAARIKENFLANMSHEIRTPMNAIIGFANLLKRKDMDTEAGKYVNMIQQSGNNLLKIINEILDLSKIEAGMLRIEHTPFNLRDTVNTVESMLRSKSNDKNLYLNISIDEMLPHVLKGDATRLSQILINLIGNAIKFTDNGGINVEFTNDGNVEGRLKMGIMVSDTGIGIEKEKLHAIFERFQQAEDSTTRKYGGTGLGLAIVNELVMLQEGKLYINSEKGKGTTFKIILPYEIAQEKIAPVFIDANIEQETLSIAHNLKGMHILVAEDNEINQSLIKYLFAQWNVNVDIVSNGKEAIAFLKRQKYNILLLDIQMPVMDGYTTIHEIRNTLGMDIPVIAMTAHALEGEKEKCLNAGMNDYLSKPITEEKLYSIIVKHTKFNKKDLIHVSEKKYETIPNSYNVIDLTYMKTISMGNKDYEKTVTQQFIESIFGELDAMENAWNDKDEEHVKKIAHNMKTTVSIMGLTHKLNIHLDVLEYNALTPEIFWKHFHIISDICKNAVIEAKAFYNTI